MDDGGSMRAWVQDRYGSADVLELREVTRPAAVEDRVLIRVRAASVNALDWHVMRGEPYVVRLSEGLRRPKLAVRGADMAGEVVAVGPDVTRFRPGDAVIGHGVGAFADVAAVREVGVVAKPERISFVEAAAVPVAATTALQGLRDHGGVRPGRHVLVHGAGGGVGTFAVQLAHWLGAEVTAVTSTANLELVRSIGADHVLDYTREAVTDGEARFDVILDIAGTRPLGALARILRPEGIVVIVGGPAGRWVGPLVGMAQATIRSRRGDRRFVSFLARRNQDDLVVLRDLLAAGTLAPVIERTYPFAEVREAIRHVESGRVRGKVVVEVA